MLKNDMRDLKIIAEMKDGRVASYNFDLMFDGILYSAFVKCYLPDLYKKPTQDFTDFELPLERKIFAENDFYYLCSKAFFESDKENRQDIEFFNKRQDLNEAERFLDDSASKKDIVDARGKYKAYRNALVVRYTKNIFWYARGIKSEIEKLLNYIDAIGSKHNIGYGKVKSWTVEESTRIIFDKSMRPIPNENGNCLKRIRPPYHYFKRNRRCDFDL